MLTFLAEKEENNSSPEHTNHVTIVLSKPTKRGRVVFFPVLLGFSPDRRTFKSRGRYLSSGISGWPVGMCRWYEKKMVIEGVHPKNLREKEGYGEIF